MEFGVSDGFDTYQRPRNNDDKLNELRDLIRSELDNFVVKDTYTKGKNAGLRKALVLIDNIETEIS